MKTKRRSGIVLPARMRVAGQMKDKRLKRDQEPDVHLESVIHCFMKNIILCGEDPKSIPSDCKSDNKVEVTCEFCLELWIV